MYYRHNDEQVAAEEFDGEFVVIHFASGRYFSLRNAAVDVWRQFRNGASVDAVAARVSERFTLAPGEGCAQLERCIRLLIDEGLLCAAPTAGAAVDEWSAEAWSAPSVEVYSDLQDLIVLDPVHEVDYSSGWPRRAAGGDDA
jgi:hypothetical protein